MDSKVEVSGKAPQQQWHAQVQNVSETYFRVFVIRFEMGRGFTEAEVHDARKVAIVNRRFVLSYLGGEDPIGRRIKLAGLKTLGEPSFEVVGVAGDVANQGSGGYGSGGLRTPGSTAGVGAVYGRLTSLVIFHNTP